MGLDTTLARYRMTIALAAALLGPTVLGVLLSLAGMTSAAQIGTMTQLVVWAVGLWALGSAGWELYRGIGRYRSNENAEATDATPAP